MAPAKLYFPQRNRAPREPLNTVVSGHKNRNYTKMGKFGNRIAAVFEQRRPETSGKNIL
jgi:hypothetical protein